MTPVLMTLSLFVATAVAQLVYGSTLYFACTAMEAGHVTFKHAFTNAMGVLILSLFVVLTTVAVLDHGSWIFLFLPAWMAITVISYVSKPVRGVVQPIARHPAARGHVLRGNGPRRRPGRRAGPGANGGGVAVRAVEHCGCHGAVGPAASRAVASPPSAAG